MDLQVGVKIFLRNKSGQYLLLERNQDKYADINKSNKWDIVGGRINPGTPLVDNLEREILEETGLTLVAQPRLIAAQDILKPGKNFSDSQNSSQQSFIAPEKHVVRLTYFADIDGDPVLGSTDLASEHLSFKWFSREELDNLQQLDSYAREALCKLDLAVSGLELG